MYCHLWAILLLTMVEGSALKRHVIANDINPLAAFITKCETNVVDVTDYSRVMSEILEEVEAFSNPFFTTENRETGEQLPVRWYEHAYLVECPYCGKKTSLASTNKRIVNGKEKKDGIPVPAVANLSQEFLLSMLERLPIILTIYPRSQRLLG